MKFKVLFVIRIQGAGVSQEAVEFDSKEEAYDACSSFTQRVREGSYATHYQAIPLFLERNPK